MIIKTLSFLATLALTSFSPTNAETSRISGLSISNFTDRGPFGPLRPAGKAGCACTGVCKVRGDPHVQNIWGESFLETREEFTLFQGYGIDISAKTFGRFYMGEISFGEIQTFSAGNCAKSGALGGPMIYTQGQTTVTLQVECDRNRRSQQSGGPNRGFFLNVVELRITSGSGRLEEIDARGVCVEYKDGDNREEEMGNTVDTVDFGKNNKGPVCECVGSCSIVGDPHVTTFAGNRFLNEGPGMLIYQVGNFEITAKVTANRFYTKSITIRQGRNEQTIDRSMCTNAPFRRGQREIRLAGFDLQVGNGRVNGVINCARVIRGGRFKGDRLLNLYINRVETSNTASSFLMIEAQMSSTGVCTVGNPFI